MLRQFTDNSGIDWRVWDVSPVLHSEAQSAKRARTPTTPAGWLCFESPQERRRLSPIPAEWETLDALALTELCTKAEVVPRLARDATWPFILPEGTKTE